MAGAQGGGPRSAPAHSPLGVPLSTHPLPVWCPLKAPQLDLDGGCSQEAGLWAHTTLLAYLSFHIYKWGTIAPAHMCPSHSLLWASLCLCWTPRSSWKPMRPCPSPGCPQVHVQPMEPSEISHGH